jgi:hypothetical protein
VTKADIIAKTLKDMGPFLLQHEPPYSDEPDGEEIVIAELQRRLPEKVDIKTCEDFWYLHVECCGICHECYHYEMSLLDLPNGAKAWVCDSIKWDDLSRAIPETPRVEAKLPQGKLLRRIFGKNADE